MLSEWIEIKATLHAQDNSEFLCSSCLHKYDSRKDKDIMVEKSRAAKACTEIRDKAFLPVDDKLSFKTCPGNYYRPSIAAWINNARVYQNKGILPFPGSFMEQPAKVIEFFNIIEAHSVEKAIAEKKRNSLQGEKTVRRGR